MKTLQDAYIEKAKNCANRIELGALGDKMADEIMGTDSRLYSISRKWVYYGTWKISLWVNSCHFGDDLARMLQEECSFITHDEEAEFSLEDFREDICIAVGEFLYRNWD